MGELEPELLKTGCAVEIHALCSSEKKHDSIRIYTIMYKQYIEIQTRKTHKNVKSAGPLHLT